MTSEDKDWVYQIYLKYFLLLSFYYHRQCCLIDTLVGIISCDCSSISLSSAVRRKDETFETHTLRDLEQLIERIQKMHHSSNNNDNSDKPHSASSIHYTHILNDPFITQTQKHISTMEDIVDDPSLYNDNDISSPVKALSPTMPIITPAIATTATTDINENRNCQHPSKDRIFVERFYQQLPHELSPLMVWQIHHRARRIK